MERSVGRQVVVKFPKSSERSECGQQPRGGHPAWSMPHEAARVGDRQRVGDKQPLPRSLTPAEKTGPGGAAVRATPGSAQAQGLLCTEDRAAPRPGPALGGLLQPQSHTGRTGLPSGCSCLARLARSSAPPPPTSAPARVPQGRVCHTRCHIDKRL